MKIDSTELNRLKDELKHLVLISSQSKDAEGVNQVQRYIAQELKKIGFKVELKNSSAPTTGDLLVATLKQKHKKNLKFITLVCHADTVLGLDQFSGFFVTKDGQKAVGSGVIDDKGGIVVLIDGLRTYLAHSKNRRLPFHIRVVSSPSEEVGSTGFHKVFKSFSKDSFAILGFEPALDDGSIIDSRRGNRWYQVWIKGRSSHAGRTKGEHVNAAHVLASKITRLVKLNNFKREMSLNVAQISGGTEKFNITCGEAQFKIDIRYARFEDCELMHKKIKQILSTNQFSSNRKTKSKTKFQIVDDCPPFASNLNSKLAVRKLIQIVSKIEKRNILAQKAGGAGDVNYMSEKKLIVIDGLGPVGGALHTKLEFVHLSTLHTRSKALSQFLTYLCTLRS